MFRLRTTASLSLLALAIGVAGTAWLSTLTDQWKGPAGSSSPRTDKVRMVLRRHARAPAASERAVAAVAARSVAEPTKPAVEALPMLTPVDMPALPASWLQRTAFASGRVVLRLGIDAEGRVGQARVAESSGNPGLDERALRTVEHWRFAVPADHPEGLSGQLVMRFDDTKSQE
ncbi:energy transducer TonB [Dyella telluris]|uniref:Energy transducer TonB n=1 Tax=Dyella telluris TaxID=2763498 RepID=A0A7G8Q9N9_9GAMM|nr:energy transducer TonB [Dyella telluris]QNK03497.1 energy transducer TonB [Dyella telluris]